MLKLTLLTVGIVAAALLLLSINIIVRGGKFRGEHVGQSKAMRQKGIHCLQSMDRIERMKDPHHATKTERKREMREDKRNITIREKGK
ncbi:MAG: hypothetical protein LUC44_03795 [Prevotellaceae bacterium]|nr:hypothetical protein [Prevotellaceae bacterium]